jgi:hypothetical protein
MASPDSDTQTQMTGLCFVSANAISAKSCADESSFPELGRHSRSERVPARTCVDHDHRKLTERT